MLRVLVIFVLVGFLAAGIAWFADRPGEITITWLGYEIHTSLMLTVGVIVLGFIAMVATWTVLRGLLGAPGAITSFFRNRRQARGLEALTRGVVAAGAGDAGAARRYAALAHRSLGDTPLAQLLRAQAAQLSGDRATVHLVFDQMLGDRDTEVLGLRGLFVQAQQEGQAGQARAYAERALAINPHLGWAARAVLAMQAGAGDWAAAEATIEACRRHKLLDADEANAKLAAVATARAMRLEERDPGAALEQALVAHKLAPALVPAAVIAGRLLAATGQQRKAAKTLEKTWRLTPHPDVAEIYGAVYTGRSPRERLKRVKALVAKAPAAAEGPIAIARAAVEARDWDQAHAALQPLADSVPSARVCALMAEIEFGAHADEGRARQWLASAMHAPRDPAWVADGHVSETWAPTSPATGELGAFEWKVPMDAMAAGAAAATPAIAARDAAEAEAEAPAEAADAEPQAAAPAPSDATDQEPVAEPVRVEAPEDVRGEPAAVEEKPAAPAKPARRREEAAVFVPPRPPDDPGPEPREEESGNWFQTLFAR